MGIVYPKLMSKNSQMKTLMINKNFKEISDGQVQAFLDESMDEADTDTLVSNILVQIVGLHQYSLRVRWATMRVIFCLWLISIIF